MAVSRTDDFDGGRADETVPFSLDGQFYELDLNTANAAAFRRVLGPYIKQARPVPGSRVVLYMPGSQTAGLLGLNEDMQCEQFAVAAAGTFTATAQLGAGYLPETRPKLQLHTYSVPAQPDSSSTGADQEPEEPATPPQPPGNAPDPDVRAWAKIWSVPCPLRGRVPASVHAIYKAFQEEDREPWREKLEENGINPAKAEAAALEALAAASQAPASPTEDDLARKAAKQLGTLTSKQVEKLRLLYNAEDGRVTSDSSDAASFKALVSRECCKVIKSTRSKTTYEITRTGRLWFEVHGVKTDD